MTFITSGGNSFTKMGRHSKSEFPINLGQTPGATNKCKNYKKGHFIEFKGELRN